MYRPTRRSRKIGRTQGGRVKHGRAREKASRGPALEPGPGPGDRVAVIRENPSRDFFHPCDERGIRVVLRHLPKRHRRRIGAIILGRTSKSGQRRRVEGTAYHRRIVLNAFPRSREMWWYDQPGDAAFRHYDRWCSNWSIRGRWWVLTWSTAELERYYLYHLLLHEIGHLVDPRWRSSRAAREAFAENYALEWARKLRRLRRAGTDPAARR